nr:unnamed protein product [Callosobruchus chinensis]
MLHIGRCILVLSVCVFQTVVEAGFTTTKISPRPIWNSTDTDKLRKDLLLNYDKFARPAQHFNATAVRFGLSILHVEANEFKSTFTVFSVLHLAWTDEKLKWNSSDYGGIKKLHLAEHEIWQPDISLFNSASSISVSHYSNTHFVAFSYGEVSWSPPAQFTVLCNFDLRYWPFDTQHCHLHFMSWTYNGDQIDIDFIDSKAITFDVLINNTEWTLIEATQKKVSKDYPCCDVSYPYLVVNFTIARSSPSYKAIIVTPTFVIIALTLVNFWLPPQAGEKIIINASTALMICLFMLYFTQKLPAMGTHTPLIVMFYSSCLYIVTFSMIGSVIVMTISRTKHSRSLPWMIKQPLTGTFGKLLGLGPYIKQSSVTHRVTAEEMRDHQVTDFDDATSIDERHIIGSSSRINKPSTQDDWILLAAAIDRISFVFYCILFGILSIVYAV